MSVDMGNFIAPKSDQLNADDLIAGPRTIKVTSVRASSKGGDDQQPISINFDGDGGKPYKPCKSMRRVLVSVWGTDAAKYVGRSMTIYRDESVKFGNDNVGGIRISHMSHIDGPQTMALTATRARRAPFTVQPLPRTAATTTAASSVPTAEEYDACRDTAAFESLEQRRRDGWGKTSAEQKRALKAASDAAKARLSAPAQTSTAQLDGSESAAIAGLEAAFKNGRDAVRAEMTRIESDYAARNQPIPLAVDAKYGELNEALKE